MSNVSRIRHEMPVSIDIAQALAVLYQALVKAISAAREAGLPRGFFVALLHGQAHSETARMVG
ncbi:hypothetical protein [Pseudomonas sp. 6D_7.1_Bac1]|jgi:hypothetical protein|uniref:hypothetical protein n=1 Tax=Pseudomonas sp. 6D_7.1_Bac1 TaxID=2971615 RepID=UPI0021CA1A27|nr:hypothetical protein [Pseudomonas sp. 6D_7.1_Bac1]MCU1751968.1 hypothetical protein [Pseudomonas sp. 6D_7.1_Bac1]